MNKGEALALAFPRIMAFNTTSGTFVKVNGFVVGNGGEEPFLYDNTNQKIEDSTGEAILVNGATSYTSAYTAAQIDQMTAAGG